MKCCVKMCGELAVAAVVIVALGVVVHLQLAAVTKLHLSSCLAIVLGGVVLLIALFGFSGVYRMSHCMLIVYAVIMLLVMLVKMAFAVIIFTKLESILHGIPHWLDQSFSNLASFRTVESTFHCCGPHSPTDYNLELPDTCCATQPCTEHNSYPGCSVVLHSFFNTFSIPAAVVALIVALIELIAVVVVLTLIHNSRKKDKKLNHLRKSHSKLVTVEHAEGQADKHTP